MRSRNFFIFFLLLVLILSAYLPVKFDGSVSAQSGNRKPAENKKKQTQEGEEVIDAGKGQTIKIETELISVDVVVRDKKTNGIYQGLGKKHFAVFEDGVQQEIVNFQPTEAPLTLVLLLEYSRQIGGIRNEIINPTAQFVTNFVKPKDQVAIVAFDIRPAVLNDFTDNPNQLAASVNLLIRNLPAWNESNLFDALAFVIEGGKLEKEEYAGIKELQGKAAILLISLGNDTFSKINYDKTLKIVERAGIPIYSIGIGNLFFKLYEHRMSDEARLTFLQAGNQLRSFSEKSGGLYFPVTFQGEIPTNLKAIEAFLRNQYSLTYTPTNTRKDGKRRKIDVHIDLNGDGKFEDDKMILQYRKSYVEPKG
jgi:Ca-activated chloride channel homolog